MNRAYNLPGHTENLLVAEDRYSRVPELYGDLKMFPARKNTNHEFNPGIVAHLHEV